MSEPHAKIDREIAANPVGLLAGSPLARVVHDPSKAVGLMLSLLVAGCVIPPSLSVDNQDAGTNSPPAITAVRADDKVLVEADIMNTALFIPGEGSISVALLDTDLTDTLYVRVFVDYSVDDPVAARASCTAPPVDSARRTVTCDVGAVCRPGDVTTGKTLNMNVMVFDRTVLESGDPPFQAVADGGLTSSKFFFLECESGGT
jgi:hypothetical protein